MQIDREKALKTFNDYVKNYDEKDPKIKLKIDHTYRVMALCESLAKSLGWSIEDIDMAWLCGLLHDVGRFEQLRRYNTFSDALSVDHAMLGTKILFEEGKIRDYICDDSKDNLLKMAVMHHSEYRIPENLSDSEKRFCNILRDADKIDILRVNIEVPLEEIYNTTSEELYNSEITPEVLAAFKEKHAILRSLKKTPVDNVVGHISLVFELVYTYSYKIVEEQGYLKKLCEFKSENNDTVHNFKMIDKFMEDFLKEKSKNN